MNKSQMIQNIAKASETSKAAAERIVNAFLAEIEKGVKKDRQVSIVGFGTFKVRNRKARIGRNPKTGARIKIKATRTVGFKPGKPFRKAVG